MELGKIIYLLLGFASPLQGRKNSQEAERDAANQGVEVSEQRLACQKPWQFQ